MANGKNNRRGNLILDSIPEREYSRFLNQLQRVEVGVKDVVQEPGRLVRNVYFPIDAVFSLVATTEDHSVVEVATMGTEGLVGLSVFLGHPEGTLTVFSQVPGSCWKSATEPFREAVSNGSWLREALHRYTQCVMVQISQGVICNARHAVLQRCARWLLMTMDRVQRAEFLLTQEFLAQMLAARRGSVSGAASALQSKGCIEYSRGRVKVIDRKGLENESCECYQKITGEYKKFAKFIRDLRSGA